MKWSISMKAGELPIRLAVANTRINISGGSLGSGNLVRRIVIDSNDMRATNRAD
jgi:hypothetical protein